MKSIGERLKQARKENKLTADIIADRMSISRRSVYVLEDRKKLDFATLKKVIEAYEKPASYFLEYLDEDDKSILLIDEVESFIHPQVAEESKHEYQTRNVEVTELYKKIMELQEEIIELQKENMELRKQLNS